MGIARSQMNRQMYGIGSYFPPENGREKFGLGSKLKKFVRNIIPNEVAKVASVAAPFVAPFNPLLAGAMAGIGGFDQTGRIGSSLKSAALTYGAGQLGRYIGGAGFQQGIDPFAGYNPASSFGGISSLFTSPIGTQTGLQLGQYEMFGGPGSEAFKASQVTDPGVVVSGTPPVQPGTFIGEGIDAGTRVADYTGEIISDVGGNTAKKVTRGYMDIFKDLTSGNYTEMGKAAKELGGKALKDIYTTPVKPYVDASGNLVDSKLDKTAILATLVTIPSYLDAKKVAKEAGLSENEFDEVTYNAERDKYMAKYKGSLPTSSFGIQQAANGGIIGLRNGGRIGYAEGDFVYPTDQDSAVQYIDPDTGKPMSKDEWLKKSLEEEMMSPTDQGSGVIYRNEQGNPISKEEWLRLSSEAPSITLPEKGIKGIIPPKRPMEMKKKRVMEMLKKGGGALEKETLDYLLEKYGSIENKANGGRMGYMFGSEVPVRNNQGGISELDYRNTGGFVPVGVKEKADDVPAMLSKNEFVFTADAVRAAGGGSINKGAKKMYDTMKALENKVV